jgi:hypothetical protein
MSKNSIGVLLGQEAKEKHVQERRNSGRFSASHLRTEPESRTAGWIQLITAVCSLVLMIVIGLPATACAQKAKDSWSNLNGLKAGQGIEVIESNMKNHNGRFAAITEESLSMQEKGSDVLIKREDVVRVSTGSGPKRGEHAVIGLVAGGLIGAGIGALAGSSHGFFGASDRGIAALVGIAIGAPSGALVGAVVPAPTTVYRAAPGKARQTTSPQTNARSQ